MNTPNARQGIHGPGPSTAECAAGVGQSHGADSTGQRSAPTSNIIPPVTDLMGRYWEQPPREWILTDDTHALMTQATFMRLAEYSQTMPSGVYPGKMWRRLDGQFARTEHGIIRLPPPYKWLLVWYGDDIDGQCPILFREVLLA